MATDRHRAYTALLMRHRDMLWRMCWRRADEDYDRCCDLMQDVSIALWDNFDKLRPDAVAGQERAWVRWQARSVFYQKGRQQKPETVSLGENVCDSVSAEDQLQRKETIDNLLSALDSEEQRMVQMYLQGYRGDEISQQMGISRDNYYQRMHRAIRKMQRLALILLALLFTSALAIAAVPQWRHAVFGAFEGVKDTIDSVSEPLLTNSDELSMADTAFIGDTIATDSVSASLEIRSRRMPSLDSLGYVFFDPFSFVEMPDSLTPVARYDKLRVTVDGTRIFITGADGEQVKVYDRNGRLVYAQVAGSLCIIDLFLNPDPVIPVFCYRYFLQVGYRPLMAIDL